jgi:nicotinate-nucleotide adenylyltransferase
MSRRDEKGAPKNWGFRGPVEMMAPEGMMGRPADTFGQSRQETPFKTVRPEMRIGIFGGSFDPVHLGHLWIAESALETLDLDEIRWVPAATSPLKPAGPTASDEDRLQMVRLAVSGCQHHIVDDREIRRGDVSYTVDTIDEFRKEFPDADLFMILGSDSLSAIRQWHRPDRLLQLAIPAVVQRGGDEEIDFSVLEGFLDHQRMDVVRRHVIAMPVIEISSHELRQRIGEGRSIRFRVPRAVEAMINSQGIYRE